MEYWCISSTNISVELTAPQSYEPQLKVWVTAIVFALRVVIEAKLVGQHLTPECKDQYRIESLRFKSARTQA